MTGRTLWSKVKGLKTYLEPEEVTRLENAASNLRDRLLIRLLFHLGCRVSEALALAIENIDFTVVARLPFSI
jgi:integrase